LANGINDSKVITNALLIISISMLTELAIMNNFNKFAKVLFGILFWLITINCILCIIYPNGLKIATLYDQWDNPLYFIGIDNAMIKELIPMIFIMYYIKLCDKNNLILKSNRKKNYIFVFVNVSCFITVLIVGSATGIAVFILFIIMEIGFSLILNRKLPYKRILIIYNLLFMIIVVMGSNLQIISYFTGLLGRTSTFTGRSLLWQNAISMILKRPLIGYGYTSGNISVWGGFYSSHNMFLESILHGGFIYFTMFVFITLYAIRKNEKGNVNYSNLVFMGIFMYLLIGLVESGIDPFYFMLIIFACYPNLKKQGLMIRLK